MMRVGRIFTICDRLYWHSSCNPMKGNVCHHVFLPNRSDFVAVSQVNVTTYGPDLPYVCSHYRALLSTEHLANPICSNHTHQRSPWLSRLSIFHLMSLPLCYTIPSPYRTPVSMYHTTHTSTLSQQPLLLPRQTKRIDNPLLRPSSPPHILTVRLVLQHLLLLSIPLLNQALLDLGPTVAVLRPHAEPEIVPVLATTAQLPVTVQVIEVPAQRGAVKC